MSFKGFAEIHGGIKAAFQSNFCDGHVGVYQQFAGVLNFYMVDVMGDGHAGIFFENPA